jgi:hypothetical protein
MATRLGWRIYYADRTVIDGVTLSDWTEAPDENILVVVEVFSKGNRKKDLYTIQVHAGQDYYWMVPELTDFMHKNVLHTYEAFEITGSAARLIPDNAHIKRGVFVTDELYSEILNQANNAPTYGSFG